MGANILIEKLPNGLTLIVVPRPNVQVVTVDMWVNAGSADEPSHINGVSHFLEHMLFKGTDQFKVGEIDRLVEGTGGYLNAGTSHDFTHYYITLASENFRTALHVLADVIQNSRLETEEMDRERQVILEEYYRKQDDPEGVLWERLYEQVFLTGPYKLPVLGTPETLAAIQRPQMLDYYHRHYSPSNMLLLVVGDIDPAQVIAAAKEELNSFSRPYEPILQRSQWQTQYSRSQEVFIEKEVNETYCGLVFPAPSVDDFHRAYSLDMLQYILGGGRASLLYSEVKEKRQLATSIGAGYATSRFPDLFFIFATCDEANRRKMIEAIHEQIDSVAQKPPEPSQMQRARKLLTNSHAFSLETTSGQSSSIGYYYTITGSTDFEANYAKGIAAVTADDVQRQAQQWLTRDSANLVAVRPKGV